MGIRFYCPNGHKVHVKDFQAGQKGFCPTCGVKMQIPLESTRPNSRQQKARLQGDPAEFTASASDEDIAPPPPMIAEPSPPPGASAANTFAGAPAPPTTAATGPLGDPISLAGDAVWYVRPPSGGQFGPAAAGVMRDWLAEGRIGADALVWREGWRDWQQAANVFPQLSPRLIIQGMEAVHSAPAAPPAASRPHTHRTQAQNTRAIIVAALALAVVVLSVILIWVLKK